jgi:hypothetical protein
MEVSGQLHASAALSQGKSPWYPLDRRLGGPQSRSGSHGEEQDSKSLVGLEPQNIQPVTQNYTNKLNRIPSTNETYTISLSNSMGRVLLEELIVTQLVEKFPRFLRNPKVHYRVQNSPPPVPILSQMHPVHTFLPYFPNIHFNIILKNVQQFQCPPC